MLHFPRKEAINWDIYELICYNLIKLLVVRRAGHFPGITSYEIKKILSNLALPLEDFQGVQIQLDAYKEKPEKTWGKHGNWIHTHVPPTHRCHTHNRPIIVIF